MGNLRTIRIRHAHHLGRAKDLFVELNCFCGIPYDRARNQGVVPVRNCFSTHWRQLKPVAPTTSTSFSSRVPDLPGSPRRPYGFDRMPIPGPGNLLALAESDFKSERLPFLKSPEVGLQQLPSRKLNWWTID